MAILRIVVSWLDVVTYTQPNDCIQKHLCGGLHTRFSGEREKNGLKDRSRGRGCSENLKVY